MSGKLEALGAALRGRLVTMPGHDPAKMNGVIDLLRNEGVVIESVVPHRFSLEDILVQILADQPTVAPLARPVGR